MKDTAVMLIVIGGVLAAAGVVLLLAGKIPWLGNLPGDINLRGKNWSFSFPVVTCVVASIVLTILINVIARFFHK